MASFHTFVVALLFTASCRCQQYSKLPTLAAATQFRVGSRAGGFAPPVLAGSAFHGSVAQSPPLSPDKRPKTGVGSQGSASPRLPAASQATTDTPGGTHPGELPPATLDRNGADTAGQGEQLRAPPRAAAGHPALAPTQWPRHGRQPPSTSWRGVHDAPSSPRASATFLARGPGTGLSHPPASTRTWSARSRS